MNAISNAVTHNTMVEWLLTVHSFSFLVHFCNRIDIFGLVPFLGHPFLLTRRSVLHSFSITISYVSYHLFTKYSTEISPLVHAR